MCLFCGCFLLLEVIAFVHACCELCVFAGAWVKLFLALHVLHPSPRRHSYLLGLVILLRSIPLATILGWTAVIAGCLALCTYAAANFQIVSKRLLFTSLISSLAEVISQPSDYDDGLLMVQQIFRSPDAMLNFFALLVAGFALMRAWHEHRLRRNPFLSPALQGAMQLLSSRWIRLYHAAVEADRSADDDADGDSLFQCSECSPISCEVVESLGKILFLD